MVMDTRWQRKIFLIPRPLRSRILNGCLGLAFACPAGRFVRASVVNIFTFEQAYFPRFESVHDFVKSAFLHSSVMKG